MLNSIEYGKCVFVIVIFIIQFINSARIGIDYFIITRRLSLLVQGVFAAIRNLGQNSWS